jgi:hypothetical protein
MVARRITTKEPTAKFNRKTQAHSVYTTTSTLKFYFFWALLQRLELFKRAFFVTLCYHT